MNKKFIALFASLVLTGCGRVLPGNVGIKVDNIGEDKGINEKPLGVGYHYLGFFSDLYVFPLTEQNCVWDGKETFYFQTCEGLIASADIGITYNINPDKVFDLFRKYRTGIDSILHNFVHNYVRDEINIAASKRHIEDLYGKGKESFLVEVQSVLRERLSPIGINVHRIYLVGSVNFPKQVVEALNRKIEATQRAEQRENELREAQAEAQKHLAQIDGTTKAFLMKAKAEAESQLIKAQADAESKRLIREQLTPSMIEYYKIMQWDGRLPTITGSHEQQIRIPFEVEKK